MRVVFKSLPWPIIPTDKTQCGSWIQFLGGSFFFFLENQSKILGKALVPPYIKLIMVVLLLLIRSCQISFMWKIGISKKYRRCIIHVFMTYHSKPSEIIC